MLSINKGNPSPHSPSISELLLNTANDCNKKWIKIQYSHKLLFLVKITKFNIKWYNLGNFKTFQIG
jgi:hypothetical protein